MDAPGANLGASCFCIGAGADMEKLVRIVHMAGHVPMAVSCVALFFLMCLAFVDVLLRSIFNAPIEAATELIRMSMAVVVFAALPVLSAKGDHISVDLTDPLFHRWGLTRARDIAMPLICAALLWWPAQRVVVLAERARSYGDTTEYLNWPVFYMSWFIAIMIYITIAALVLRAIALICAPKLQEVS